MTTDSLTPAPEAAAPKPSSSNASTAAPGHTPEAAIDKKNKLVILGNDAKDVKFLTLTQDHLALDLGVEHGTSGTSFCGITWGASSTSPIPSTISYYNLLWVERKESTLEITYAETHGKHKLRPETRSVNIASFDDDAFLQQWIDTAMSRAYGRAKKQKRAKVLINPHAGPGGAMHKWEHDVQPLFLAARMTIDAQKTTHSGEAIGIVRDLNIDNFDTVIACSGDGLPYEMFNGLAEKPNARAALSKIAVSQIPCGSGNAMACNLYASPHPSEAALGIIKGIDTPIDLANVTYGNERKLSFLSQSVGIIAEADLGTEDMRWMGAARFNVGVLTRILKKRAYPCDISLKLAMDDKDAIRSHYKKQRQMQRQPAEDGAVESEVQGQDQGLPPLQFGTINDDLPEEGWEHITYDNMGNFYCGKVESAFFTPELRAPVLTYLQMAWVAPDAVFFPAATPDDGYLDLVTCDCDMSVKAQLDIMRGIGDGGSFFDHPGVVYRKVSAVRITPRDQEDGYISIDGEKIPFGPFQVEVQPKLGKVYSLKGEFEASGPPGWEKAA